MAKYRITLVNGQAWDTDEFADARAFQEFVETTGPRRPFGTFKGVAPDTPTEHARSVAVRGDHISSIEEVMP